MKNDSGFEDAKFEFFGMLAIILIVVLIGFVISSATSTTVTAQVTDKGIKRVSSDSDVYLIYTDQGTFQLSDSFYKGQFRSSDLFGKIKVGCVYRFKVYGYRVPLLSSYQNIYKLEEAEH